MARNVNFIFPSLFILAPYIDLGIATLNLSVVIALSYIAVLLQRERFFKRSLVVFIAVIFSFLAHYFASALFFDGSDFVIAKLGFSVAVYVLAGYAVGCSLARDIKCVELEIWCSRLLVFAVILNSMVILIEVAFPPVKVIIEAVLADAGNIDWARAEEKRFRGVASAGGASLSVLHAAGFVALFLVPGLQKYRKMILGGVIILSLVFVGRTGFLIMPILLLLVVFSYFGLFRLVQVGGVLGVLCVFTLQILLQFSDQFYVDYVFGFVYQEFWSWFMSQGGEEVFSFYSSPESWVNFVFGNGRFDGVWAGEGSVDSAWMRMWTAFGLFAGVIYFSYIAFTFYFFSRRRVLFFFWLSLSLAFLDFKEMFSFSGYTARYIFLVVGIYLGYEYGIKKRTRDLEGRYESVK